MKIRALVILALELVLIAAALGVLLVLCSGAFGGVDS
jgi:hypothetical protein